jgi:metal-responsive CopG/Arc/MetJ family transcriptional regulator
MKHPQVTISFSVDPEIRDELDRQAAEEKRSKSDIFRDIYRSYRFNHSLNIIQAEGRIVMMRLGLETDDDIVRHMNEG